MTGAMELLWNYEVQPVQVKATSVHLLPRNSHWEKLNYVAISWNGQLSSEQPCASIISVVIIVLCVFIICTASAVAAAVEWLSVMDATIYVHVDMADYDTGPQPCSDH